MGLYGSSSKNINEGAALGTGIHDNVFLSEVKAFTTEEDKKGRTFEVLDFIFKTKKGDYFNLRLFNPEAKENATEDKIAKAAKNTSDTVVYILGKLRNEDVTIENVESWNDFTAAIIAELPEDYDEIPLQIKLIGNVYEGKGTVKIPGINKSGWIGGGWLRRMDSTDKLVWSSNDEKVTSEYKTWLTKQSSSKDNEQLPMNSDHGFSPADSQGDMF